MEDTSKQCEAEIGQAFPPPYPEGEQVTGVSPPYPGEKQGTKIPSNPGELPDGTKYPSYTTSGEMPQTTNVSVVQTQRVIRIINRPDPPIESYFACSLFVMIFCCLPFGIVALVYATQQRSMEAVGDFEGARRASSQAKCWSCVGFFTGLVALVGFILWIFVLNPYY